MSLILTLAGAVWGASVANVTLLDVTADDTTALAAFVAV